MFSIPDNIIWPLFGTFLFLVLSNFLFGVITISLKIEKKLFVRIIGQILVILLIGFFVYIANTNSKCQDYIGYENVYYDGYHKEKGYVYITALCKDLGMSFRTFRTLFYIIAYILLYIAVTAFKGNKNFTFSLFALFPWCFNAFQMRTCMGFALITIATTFLLLKGKWKYLGVGFFTLFVFLAYSIHASMVILLIFIVIFATCKNRNIFVYTGLLISVLLVLLYFNGQNVIKDLLPDEIYSKFFDNKGYSVNVPSMIQYIELFKCVIFQFLGAFCAIFAFGSFNMDTALFPCGFNNKDDEFNIVRILFYMMACMLCLLVLLTLNIDFFRLVRNFFFFIYIMISLSMRNARFKIFNPWIILSLVFTFMSILTLVTFSDKYEWGGITMFFWIFFI